MGSSTLWSLREGDSEVDITTQGLFLKEEGGTVLGHQKSMYGSLLGMLGYGLGYEYTGRDSKKISRK